MQTTVHLPCSVRDMESALLKAAHAGYWDTAKLIGHYDKVTHKHSVIVTFGKEKKNDKSKE